MDLCVVSLSLGRIRLPKRALKEHPERQIDQIAKSIDAFGFNDPIAVDEEGNIIEGVGRVLAACKLGLLEVPAIHLKHLTETQKRAYRIAHNKITHNSGFDLAALREEFEVLSKLDEEVLLFTGFEAAEISDLLTLPELPELSPELTESLSDSKTVTCPHCGGQVHV